MAGGRGETGEFEIGDRAAVDPEVRHRGIMRRRLFRVVMIRAHAEAAALDPDHAGMWRLVPAARMKLRSRQLHQPPLRRKNPRMVLHDPRLRASLPEKIDF